MPEDNLIGKINPYIAAAAAIGNPGLQWLSNIKSRKFSREMYGRQRADALSDWAMQNEYNSPRAQMQRFQEAGLNPNLIYGQQTDSPSVRSSSASGANSQAPEISNRDVTGSLMAGYDMRQRSAQTDLVAKQMELMDEDIRLRKAQQWSTVAGAAKTEGETERVLFDLGISKELRDTTIVGKEYEVEKLKLEANKIQAEIMQMWQANPHKVKGFILDNLNKEKQLAKTDAEIADINARIQLLRQEYNIKGIDEYLAKGNINPKDPFWARSIQDLIKRLFSKK